MDIEPGEKGRESLQTNLVRRALKAAVATLPRQARAAVFDLVARGAKAAVAMLPKVAHDAVLEQICQEVGRNELGRFQLISRLAKDCGVVALKVSGKYGVIQSLPDDNTVLMEYAKNGTFAERTNGLLQSFFADRSGNYIDIGANIGLTTIPVAQNDRVSCLAIEPEPRNFANLSANIAENCSYKNVQIRRLAIYARSQTLHFEIAPGNLGDHRLRLGQKTGQLGEEKRATIAVQAVSLDEIAGNLNGPLAVKIDTQGAEPFVISGGKETLSRAGLMICEFWPYGMAQLGANPADLIEFLRSHFSTLALMEQDGPVLSRPASQVCEQLTTLVAAHSNNPEMSLDVIARR
jgi:FkbM family methyltransferase